MPNTMNGFRLNECLLLIKAIKDRAREIAFNRYLLNSRIVGKQLCHCLTPNLLSKVHLHRTTIISGQFKWKIVRINEKKRFCNFKFFLHTSNEKIFTNLLKKKIHWSENR